MPEMHPVKSSNIEAIGYEPDERKLYVLFVKSRTRVYQSIKDRTYVYYDVNESIFREFLQAFSKGKYFHKEIKNRYKREKL